MQQQQHAAIAITHAAATAITHAVATAIVSRHSHYHISSLVTLANDTNSHSDKIQIINPVTSATSNICHIATAWVTYIISHMLCPYHQAQ